jgi:glycine/D-amino acid oxidase-like deaminating enzyme
MDDHYSARRLPIDPGETGWLNILKNVPSYPSLDQDITADWVIIGGGFTGLSAARHLSDQSAGTLNIALLESNCIGAGPAGRNSGFMIDLPHALSGDSYVNDLETDRQQIRMNRLAQDFAVKVASEYDLADHCVDPWGKINAASDHNGQHHNDIYARQLDELGESYQMLSADDMFDISGSRFYSGGLYTPGTILLQPAEYITGLARGLSRSAASHFKIYEQSPALSFIRNGKHWIVKTPSGSITTGGIILAVNGHAESFGFYKRRLMHVFTYASMTKPLNNQQCKIMGGADRWGITPSDPMGTTIRRIKYGAVSRIVIRNRWSFDPSMKVSGKRVETYTRSHRLSFDRRYPDLKDVPFEYSWGGRLCLSRNNVPAFGAVDDHVISACCQNGLGTAQGTQAGIAAADLAMNKLSDYTSHLTNHDAPSKLPLRILSYIGANATIKFKEFKARREI